MVSPVVKRSTVINGHKTSVSLEDAFWGGLKGIAAEQHRTLSDVVTTVDRERHHGNLSSALRLFVLDYAKRRAAEVQASGAAGGHHGQERIGRSGTDGSGRRSRRRSGAVLNKL
jgi:predicted DNA-binding ribbon-helix-helix protein